ncbi:LysR family transcriptional regulator [Ureibacillus massiliensis 4400831 = CIP 108448 = CCUG 49529]|uniref:LysR family transcriptional regulator n=1 Tax=Ureibacillus massiliensis 4400831 = CIP 108448 = CCUG 49529 TaxID=1211035 RepID=A0A0A3JWY4_9BACL|nr:LysR family transcriptional regulator [Ureibacillus massiliensis]KGR91517.1 LysR family transcriptional regulator [Ureibacillus massiliensis 4400831 = CIP 108448 = CCUG 49529]
MDFISLMYFKTVAKYENMSRASEHLHVSQPALSKSIALLEENLGVTLFDRHGRSIKLNRYGKFFLERAEVILREYERTKEELANMVAPGHGEVSLGFMHTLGLEVIPSLLTNVKKVYPYMKFQLTQSNSSVLMEKLELGELDLCLISSLETNSDVVWEKLWEEELFLIVPIHHPLSDKKLVKVSEFAQDPFISIKKGNSLRKSVDELYKKEGFHLNVAFDGEEVHTVAGLVESGLGVSLIPKIKGLEQYQLKVIQVDAVDCKREIGLAYLEHRYLSSVSKQFADYIRGYFKN